MNSTIKELAQRIIDTDFWAARDAGADIDIIMDEIKFRPNDVIEYLLDYIDELQA